MASRRVLVAVVSVATVMGAAVVGAPPALAATCSTSWVGPATGVQLWSTAANWSAGVPTSSSDVCITKNGTYTVDLVGGGSVGTLRVGAASGTQTLLVDAATTTSTLSLQSADTSTIGVHGVLELHASANGYALVSGVAGSVISNSGVLATSGSGQPVYLRAPIANLAGATATMAAADMRQDSGTTTSNAGSFTVQAGATLAVGGSSSFTQSAGTLAVAGAYTQDSGTFSATGGAMSGQPVVLTGGSLADGAATGSIAIRGSTAVTGNIPAGQTLAVDSSVTSVQASFGGATTVRGTLAVTTSPNGYAILGGAGSLTVASGGSLTTAGSGQPAYLRVPLTNQAGGSVQIATPSTQQDSSTLTTNSSTFTIAAGGGLTVSSSSSFTQAAGTLAVAGSLVQTSGTFTASGGVQTGTPVLLGGGSFVDSAGTGAYDIQSGVSMTGSIPAGQTVTVSGAVTSTALTLTGATTVSGTLALTPAANGYVVLNGPGSVTIPKGGVLLTSGASQTAYLRVPVVNNAGSVSIGAANTVQDSSTLTRNASSFTVTPSGGFSVSSGSSFTQSAGRLDVQGSFMQTSATFTAVGGSQIGNPVSLSGVTLAEGATTGAFAVRGSSTLTGSIPVGQTVTVDGRDTSVALTLPTATTVSGTLAMTPSGNGWSMLTGNGSVTVAAGGALTTSGGGNPVYLRVPITTNVGSTFAIGTADTRMDTATTTTNSGRLAVAAGAGLALSGGATLTNTSNGTVQVAVDGTAGVASGISGPGVTVAGTLAVTTSGATPAPGSTFTPISGPVTGTFSAFAFGPFGYGVSYPGGAVVLTTTAVFTVTGTPFSPHKAIPTGTVQVATIGAAGNGTGTYSATVDWGDGTAPTAATVAISGGTGTVTSSGHTYAASGPFVVRTAVANSNGTTVTGSVTVVVPVLAVTKVAPKKGQTPGGTAVTITGTGFTGATAVSFGGTAAASLTVVSDTQITTVAPAHAAGVVDVRVTTPGGVSPVAAGDKFTYKLPPPVVTGVAPARGRAAGGTTVTIKGSGFTGATAVKFGTTAATGFTVVSDTQITATAPAHVPGVVDVRVTTAVATSALASKDRFTYVPPAPVVTGVVPGRGPAAGGTTVTITGSGFTGATAVSFGPAAGTGVTVVSDTQITVVSPSAAVGVVDVRITAPGGRSVTSKDDRYRYV